LLEHALFGAEHGRQLNILVFWYYGSLTINSETNLWEAASFFTESAWLMTCNHFLEGLKGLIVELHDLINLVRDSDSVMTAEATINHVIGQFISAG
jgi:hypothetical protein